MKPKTRINFIRLWILGALNGLLFGVAIEMLRVWHRKVEIDRYLVYGRANPSGVWADFLEPTFNVVTPLLCVIVFAGSSHLVHRVYKGRSQSVLLLWQAVGFVAASVCALLNSTNYFLLSYRGLSEALWAWLVCLAVVVSSNFIYGIVLQSSALIYACGDDG
jgi:hypothetical protein